MRERFCRATCSPQFFSIPQSVPELISALNLLFSVDYNKRTNFHYLRKCPAILGVRLNKKYLVYLPRSSQSKELLCS